jgi:hypothetical protein
MRTILRVFNELWKAELAEAGAPDTRIQECDDYFHNFDNLLGSSGSAASTALLHEAMTTGDFANALGTFVQVEAWKGYQRKRFEFEPLVKPDTLPNFQQVTVLQRRQGLDDLEYVGEKGQARAGEYPDAVSRAYQVYVWQKQFDFSWQMLVNDYLGYFQDTAQLMGESARRTLEKYVSRMYNNATSIGRLTGLGAMYSQTGRLTTTHISESRMAYNARVDAANEPINARMAYIVYPSGLEDTVRTIQASQLVPENATNAANVVRTNWIGIEDPYVAYTAPNIPWWSFTDWRAGNIIALVLARMSGWPGPMIVRRRSDIESITSLLGSGAAVNPIMGDFEGGNIVVKAMDIWGTYIDGTEGNLFDFRGAYYSSGTAP